MEAMERARPEATVHIRDAFQLLESTFFKDGREWIFGGAKPSLGDIEGMCSPTRLSLSCDPIY